METIEVWIGPVAIGGGNPVAVQSMTDTDTRDIEATVAQIARLREVGCLIARVTVPGLADVEAMRAIAERVRRQMPDVALVADVHFLPAVALALAGVVDKVRINPGNYPDPTSGAFVELIEKCRQTGTAIRIGVNHGSVGTPTASDFPDDVPGTSPATRGMVDAAMRFLRVCRAREFDAVVVSMKASDVRVMVAAYRELVAAMEAEGMAYPLHLGVTEAGNGLEGEVRSAVGVGALLVDGIGDTIRVSLTGPPENEIPVARAILAAVGLDHSRARIIACPGCGRTLFALEPVLERVKAAFGHIPGVKIAVMGCIVNGPGEMADADYGYVGGAPGLVTLYRGREVVRRNIPQADAIDALADLLNEDGLWRQAPPQK